MMHSPYLLVQLIHCFSIFMRFAYYKKHVEYHFSFKTHAVCVTSETYLDCKGISSMDVDFKDQQ